MKIKLFIIFFLGIITLSCTSNQKDFEKFLVTFKNCIENKDKNELEKYLDKDIRYSVGDKRDKYSREKIIETFDFDMVAKILSLKYEVYKKIKRVDYPIQDGSVENLEYVLRFQDKGSGWKLYRMDHLY